MNYSYNSPNWKLIGLSLAIVIIAVVGIMSYSPGITGMFSKEDQTPSGEVVVSSSDTLDEQPSCTYVDETYTELEPVTETECITVPTINNTCETRPLRYTLSKECYWSDDLSKLNTKCVLKNLDDREGTFVLDVGIVDKFGQVVKEQRTVDIFPQTSTEVMFSYTTDMGTCFCNETSVPTKEMCYDKIENNTQCFELNKYKEVEKLRTIQVCD